MRAVREETLPIRVIALVPARTESARVPGKNWRELGGRPLVEWTVEAALESEAVTEAWVVSQWRKPPVALPPTAGWLCAPEVMGLPAELEWALKELEAEEDDVVVQLLPTSPFRSGRHIDAAYKYWRQLRGWCSVLSVTPEPDLGRRLRLISDSNGQVLHVPWAANKQLVVSNGAVQVARVSWFRREPLGFHGPPPVYPLPLPLPWGLDIDEEPDWRLAQAYATEMAEQEVAV